ncbi:MAG TPA: GNAT family N-acetyltransferase [Candidatus Limnocylindrales bacterium]|nr:GNAT family N-acetyltransferase [Candidatus Limnocylindrales bacterium]
MPRAKPAGARPSARPSRAAPAIRAATHHDIPAIRAILAAHDNDGPIDETGVDIVGPYLLQLLHRHRALVTERDGEVVAFGAVVDTGAAAMLSDLFVRPDLLGQGLGRPLLAALFEGSVERATFASADPRAVPLYVRAGMTPLWTSFYVEGTAARLPPLDPGLTTWDATPEELSLLEEAWTGASRPSDHDYFARQPAADAFLVEDEEGPAAFGYGRAKQGSAARQLDRLLVRPGADPVAPIIAGLARAARKGIVRACVPGPNPVLPVLLEHGFRVVDSDQYLASSPDLVDPERMLPNPGLL